MNIDTSRTVADLAETLPGATRVFERLGIDYCCRGRVPLSTVCSDKNLSLDSTLTELERAAAGRPTPSVPHDARALIALILERHHTFTREELARLVPLSAKVRRVHGDRTPELARIDAIVHALADDLVPHMAKEERVLFPYIEQLAAGSEVNAPFGTLAGPLYVMHAEHEHVGALLEELSAVTNGYVPPDFACASYRALFAGLSHLQADLHEHIHLENHVLFPLAEQLEHARLEG